MSKNKQIQALLPDDVSATYADVTGLIEDFDYKSNTSYTEGIERFINWYKKFYSL